MRMFPTRISLTGEIGDLAKVFSIEVSYEVT
jgi:hypothetical protein